jgi:hypothetical protein
MSSICTLDDYKGFVGLTPGEAHKNDAVNQIILDGMEEAVLGYIDVSVTPKVVTNKLIDGKIEDIITTGDFPLISVQQVVFNVEADGSGGNVLDTTEYYFDDVSIMLTCQYTPRGRGTIRVDYTHGYTSVPADIKLAILQATKIFAQYHSSDAEHVGSRSKKDESESIGGTKGGVWEEESGLPVQVKGMLQKYKYIGYDAIGYAQRTK